MNIDKSNKLINALFVGLVPAIIEGILIYSVEPNTNTWILVQAVTAWFSFGFVVYLINKGNRIILNAILLTLLLNLPWYIAETVVKNTPQHFLPLVIASIVMGAIIGFISLQVNKIVKSNAK